MYGVFCRNAASFNNALQLTNNTPLRFVLRSTELKRYVRKIKTNKIKGDSEGLKIDQFKKMVNK
jgi:hypothetical protein